MIHTCREKVPSGGSNPYPELQDSALHRYGTIQRTHGRAGELVVALAQPEFIELEPRFLFLEMDAETFIPFEVEGYRGTETQWLLALGRISSLSDAERYAGLPIWIHSEELPEGFAREENLSTLIGYQLYHSPSEQLVGTIIALHDLSSNILLEVEPTATEATEATQGTGMVEPILADSVRTYLIPFAEELLVEIAPSAHMLRLSFPIELLTL